MVEFRAIHKLSDECFEKSGLHKYDKDLIY